MSDNTSVSISTTGLDIRPGDVLRQVATMNGPAIVVRFDGYTITYRAWRWYDGPRLWFRAIPARVSAWCLAFVNRFFPTEDA